MDIFNRVKAHPLNNAVAQLPGDSAGFQVSIPGSTFVRRLQGVTTPLTEKVYNYNWRQASKNTVKQSKDKKRRKTAQAAADARAGDYDTTLGLHPDIWLPPSRETGRSKKLYRPAPYSRFKGRHTGTEVHRQVEIIAKVAPAANHDMSKALKITEQVIKQNGKTSRISEYTLGIIKSLKIWNLRLVEAEWCIGDLRPIYDASNDITRVHVGYYATKIDIIAVYDNDADAETEKSGQKQPTGSSAVPTKRTPRLVLCETKTGYNDGMFTQSSGTMNPPFETFRNSPCNQAKVQLVFGAAMFVQTYGLKWSEVELNVIHCPTSAGAKLYKYKVTTAEIRACLAALRLSGMLLDVR